jgi:hypothetical protein
MTESGVRFADLRAGLVEALEDARAIEREVFAALDPGSRDTPGPGGDWSAKDTLAHLSAWRQREADKLAAELDGREGAPLPAIEIDDVNAIFHAERAGWDWERVAADAEQTGQALVAAVVAATDETLSDPKLVGSIMGDGPEHDLGHLAAIAASTGLEARVLDLAQATAAIIDRGGWPARSAAYARYNLACFHALSGRLDAARSLLRQALPGQDELRTLAPTDDDLISLRGEIPDLAAG